MIVITGPSGNVGAHLTRLMLRHADSLPLRVAAYDIDEITRLCGPSDNYFRFDYDDRDSWPSLLDGVKRLYLLFPLPSPRTARSRMQPFIDAAIAAGCEYMLFVSVGGARQNKVVPHYPVEQHLKDTGVAHTVLRPCFYMQNLCRNITTHDYDIAVYDELFLPAGKGSTALVDARDVAEACEKILLNPEPHIGEDYVLTGDECMNFYEMADVFSDVTGRDIKYVNPSLPRFVVRMLRRKIPWDVVAFMCLFYSIIRFGKPEELTDELETLVGHPPRRLRQFVEEYRECWQPESHRQLPVIPNWAGGPD